MPIKLILFDLDETLYPRECGLLKEVGRRIQMWLCDHLELTWEQAAAVRNDYFLRYGTTLNGLIAEGRVDAYDYLTFVHDVPVAAYLPPNPTLAAMLAALPLRRAIYTNATTEYSWRVLRALGVADHFEQIVGIEDVGLCNKLHREAYERALALLDVQGNECIMVEDSARNLRAAKALDMTTVLLGRDGSTAPDQNADFVIENLSDLGQVVQGLLDSIIR